MQSVKQEPIYLPDVENNTQPSHYLNPIRTSRLRDLFLASIGESKG